MCNDCFHHDQSEFWQTCDLWIINANNRRKKRRSKWTGLTRVRLSEHDKRCPPTRWQLCQWSRLTIHETRVENEFDSILADGLLHGTKPNPLHLKRSSNMKIKWNNSQWAHNYALKRRLKFLTSKTCRHGMQSLFLEASSLSRRLRWRFAKQQEGTRIESLAW